MSEANVELVRAAFLAFQQRDIDAVLRLCAENIEITQPAELPDVSRRQHGHAGVLEAFAIWPEQWDDYEIEILRLSEVGAHVVVTTMQRGRGRESGVQVEMPFTFVLSVRTGLITEWLLFMHEEQ